MQLAAAFSSDIVPYGHLVLDTDKQGVRLKVFGGLSSKVEPRL